MISRRGSSWRCGLHRALRAACWALALVSGQAIAAQTQAIGPVAISGFRIGFDGAYKLGCWTQVEVELTGGDAEAAGFIEVTTADSEGVPVTVRTLGDVPVEIAPGKTVAIPLFVRPGQDGASMTVRVVDEDGEEMAARTFFPGDGQADFPTGLPATNRLVVSFGATRGLGDLVRGEDSNERAAATVAVELDTAGDLPIEWFGYEGIDLVVLSTAQPALFKGITSDDPRVAALERWIQLGGRVVIFAGADSTELLAAGGPLAPLLPGRFDEVVPLREAQPIETFSGTATLIDPTRGGATTAIVSGQRFQLPVPRLVDVEGDILAFSGPEPTDLPLVVRRDKGLGQITFAAIDPDAPPLADWAGRINLLRQALQWPVAAPGGEASARVYGQVDDLMDRLRRALDNSLAGITAIPFTWVALAVVIYVALIGPGDYYLLRRGVKWMQLTWLTFPLVALAISAGAYWTAHRWKGSELRVNQLEIVDVDLGAGEARGTLWTHFFNPDVARRDLRLAPRFGAALIESPNQVLAGWIGATGFGLDGMQGRRGQLGQFELGYELDPQLNAMKDMPLQQWSSRTITGRWTASVEQPLQADLQVLADHLLAGEVVNRSGVKLENCVLMHANWAYPLPDLADGEAAKIVEGQQAGTVRAALVLGGQARGDVAPQLDPLAASVPEIATAMMFFEAVGGRGYAQAVNRYQSFVDLSRLLRGDHAILLARAATPGSQWIDGETPLASDDDQHWTYYRFVVPLEKQ